LALARRLNLVSGELEPVDKGSAKTYDVSVEKLESNADIEITLSYKDLAIKRVVVSDGIIAVKGPIIQNGTIFYRGRVTEDASKNLMVMTVETEATGQVAGVLSAEGDLIRADGSREKIISTSEQVESSASLITVPMAIGIVTAVGAVYGAGMYIVYRRKYSLGLGAKKTNTFGA